MSKRVFFSFHYQDVIDFRANVVRNHWLTKKDREAAGFFDASIWEDAKKESDLALKRLINKGVQNTSVTAVLIGSQTFNRRWVSYEIIKSFEKGNRIVGVHINSIKGKDQKTKKKGPNPLYYLGYKISSDGKRLDFHDFVQGEWVDYTDVPGYTLNKIAPVEQRDKYVRLSTIYNVYDWVDDDGYNNFSKWVE
tara:strand:- start:41 stop:619 length:579 start_codon:yes stop_codon:yes gene_type:complete